MARTKICDKCEDDKCPECGGSFRATGGKPRYGKYQCQKCHIEELMREGSK